MANKEKNVVLNFKMDGQVKYADTLREINSVMNTAAKEYRNQVTAMGNDAKATDKLTAEKKKLEIQMEGAQKRTKMLREQYEAMSKDTKTTTGQLTQMYGKLLDAEKAELALQKSMDRVNNELSEQSQEVREAEKTLDDLGSEAQLLEAEQKKLTSSFELQRSELGENAKESDKAKLAQKQLTKQMELAERSVQNLEQQLEATKRIYGENSVEVMRMETRLNEARSGISKFNNSLDDMEDSGEKAGHSLNGLKGGMQSLAGAAGIAAIGALVEGMEETNRQLASLEIQAQNANLAMSDFDKARSNFAGVGQDVGQTTEAMGNLVQAGYDTEKALSSVSEGISGAVVKYGETFSSEGLAESINSTTQLGEVTGQLTDLLEKEGVDVENFNKKLEGMGSVSERANLLSQTLADQGLNSMYNKYLEANPEITKNAEAQLEMQDAMSELSVILTPMVTQVAEFTTKVIEWANENPRLTAGVAAITAGLGALVVAIGALSVVLTPIGGIVIGITALIAGLILVIQNWGEITDWLGEKWEQFVTWITGILETLKTVFFSALDWLDNKTGGKFSNIIQTIKDYMNMGLDNIKRILQFITDTFRNGLDFLEALVSGDFEGMWKAVKNQMGNIEDTVGDIWGNVMDFFKGIDLWEIGKDIIASFIRGFKSLKIPTPDFDFSTTWKDIPGPAPSIPIPNFDVKWNARNSVFKKPNLFIGKDSKTSEVNFRSIIKNNKIFKKVVQLNDLNYGNDF